jgi:hypothetical protein
MVGLAGPHWLAWLGLTRLESELLRQLPTGSVSDYSAARRGRRREPQARFRDHRAPRVLKILLPEAAR